MGYKVIATVTMAEKWHDIESSKSFVDTLSFVYQCDTILEAFDNAHAKIKRMTGISDNIAFTPKDRSLRTELLLDAYMNVPSAKTMLDWEHGLVELYAVEITLDFKRIEEKRILKKEFTELKEKIMWDLETLRKINGEEPEVQENTEESTDEE